jgi:hypothetical protein
MMTMSQGMLAASRGWNSQGMDCPQEPPEERQLSWHLDFIFERSFSDLFWPLEM